MLKDDLMKFMEFQEGVFPVRYLGVPLISSKLKMEDCRPLIDRITQRVRSWTNRCLSYAGRLQLLKSILFAIQVYWSGMFILPKKVIKGIEQILKGFLWSGVDMKTNCAKVAWQDVCTPKEEGGLGIKRLEDWNKAAATRHIWNLLNDGSQSIWSKWVRNQFLKGRNFWMIQPPAICSWAWRKILKLRGEVRCNFQHIIGNGEKTSLWYDYWLPIGPIVLAKGERVIYDAGLGRNPLVAAIIFEGAWRWPVASSIDLIELKNTTHQLALPNCGVDDKIRWMGNASGMFSVHEAWLKFRISQSLVPWHKLIWHNKAIPRHAFVLWLAVRNRLNTQDKLIVYGVISSVSRVFCRLKEESHDHLFFECSFTARIWAVLTAKIAIQWQGGKWNDFIMWAAVHLKGKTLAKTISRVLLAASVYTIWKDRNARIFQNNYRDTISIQNDIFGAVQARLCQLKGFKATQSNRWHQREWNLPDSILV